MTTLKSLRNRINTINSTKKITKAMQIVSSIKLKKMQQQALNTKGYSAALTDIMSSVVKDIVQGDPLEHKIQELAEDYYHFFDSTTIPSLTRNHESSDLSPHNILWVIVTSNRGLCGSFNTSLLNYVKQNLAEQTTEQTAKQSEAKCPQNIKFLVIGRKGHDLLKVKYSDAIIGYHHVINEDLEVVASLVKDQIIKMIQNQEITTCYVYYNRFKNALTQAVTKRQIIPFVSNSSVEQSGYIYEGSKVIPELLNLYIKGTIHHALLESKASEEGARMTAMDNATRNSQELIEKLNIKLNKSRQAGITTELNEIISGAEAI